MSVSQVQRKLEFPVKKRSTRQSKNILSKEADENTVLKDKQLLSSPRKRQGKGDENVSMHDTPSPSKKQKETRSGSRRREETPIRSSLATKFAAAKVTDQENENKVVCRRGETPTRKGTSSKKTIKVDEKHADVLKHQTILPLSPRKQFDNAANIQAQTLSPKKLLQSPLKVNTANSSPGKLSVKAQISSPRKLLQSPLKVGAANSSPGKLSVKAQISSPRKLLQSPLKVGTANSSPAKLSVKGLSVKKALAENSPVKRSPVLKLHKQDGHAYNQAKQSFHTAKPERLVGRDKEMSEIHAFLKGHMSTKTSGSLYISGAPGTGKTAVLTHIIDELKGSHSCKTLYLNCMTLKDSATVFGKLYTDLTGKNAPTAKERLRAFEKSLTSDGPSIIMVLDEIDQLDSKNQEILYTIFEWPSLPKSRLILVGIANALDLTDRTLPRLQARPNCKPELLNFAPYNKEQISAIIKDRLKDLEVEGLDVMDSTAVQFCARKISAVAGDMRKALDVCRRAVEMVETDVRSQRVLKTNASECNSPKKSSADVPKKISVVHINKVLSDVYGSGSAASQQETIPLQQKLVMCSLLLMLKQGKLKEVTVGKLHEIYSKVCKKRQMGAVDHSEFQGITTLLESRGMIGIKKAKETRLAKVTLKLDEGELEHAMQDKVLISSILQEGIPK